MYVLRTELCVCVRVCVDDGNKHSSISTTNYTSTEFYRSDGDIFFMHQAGVFQTKVPNFFFAVRLDE